MFKNVFIEQDLIEHPRTKHILQNITYQDIKYLDKYDDVWGKVKKPYLQKRDNLNLFIAQKKGQLLKKTPDAYGINDGDHYYFIHSYNCIYECEYCYLQGYFNTPDIVFFINHEQIIEQMQKKVDQTEGKVWFHAGEFSDSLNTSHISNEYKLYYEFFKKNKNAYLELRTKSVNIRTLLKLPPLNNIITSFSIASDTSAKSFDHKCPSIKARLNTIEKLISLDYSIGLHLDPIIYQENFLNEYEAVFQRLKNFNQEKIEYISIGVVRFTKEIYRQMQLNYPDSPIHQVDLVKSFDNKYRYNKPMRSWILNGIKDLLIRTGISEDKIYYCME